MKEIIDNELEAVCFSERMRKKVLHSVNRDRKKNGIMRKGIVALSMLLIMSGIAVCASHIIQSISINGEELPELDAMKVVEINLNRGDFFISYDSMVKKLGPALLDSEKAENIGMEEIAIQTNYTSYCTIKMENYFGQNEEEGIYSPVELEINCILSEGQLSHGWSVEYLGMYELVEHYVSKKGYKVNVIQETDGKGGSSERVTDKRAIFVADGVMYTLKGKVSVEVMKELVDSME